MTPKDFITKIINLYGDFTTPGMAKEFYDIISKYSGQQLERLMSEYIRSVPGIYKPDVKCILECIDRLGVKVEVQTKHCLCCGWIMDSKADMCNRCGYSPEYNLLEYQQQLAINQEKIAKLLANFSVGLKNKGV